MTSPSRAATAEMLLASGPLNQGRPAPAEVAAAAVAVFGCRDLNALAKTPAPAGGTTPGAARGITITVYGTPGPQGSKSYKGTRTSKRTGKPTPILVESSKKVRPWREAVEDAARVALAALRPPGRLQYPLTTPLDVSMVFSLQAPARIPADRFVDGIPYPSCYPDSSKLVRSTEDALTGVLWADDALIVRHGLVEKRYAGWPGSLDRPGAVITVRPFGGER